MQRQTIAKLTMSIAMMGMFMMGTVMAQDNNNVPVPPIVEAQKYRQHKDNPTQSPLPGANKSSAKVTTRSSARSKAQTKTSSKAKTSTKTSTRVKSS